MTFVTKTFYSQEDLVRHLKAHQPSFYFSSKTSTVIPYDKLETLLPWKKDGEYFLCDLSKLPAHMEVKENGNLVLRGAVSWEEAKKFLRSKGRNLKTSPTEQLALITAGIATSCTGERCFAFGNMRSQVVRLKYLDFNGEEKELKREDEFKSASSALAAYQSDFKHYQNFKNAPYPRFEKAIDLMIGTEGQLGLVTEVEIETTDNEPVTYVFTLLPRWEEDFTAHMEIFHAVQSHRDAIISCELLDANCMNYLKPDEKLGNNQDVIFLEVKSSAFEDIYANVLCNLTHTSADNVFEIAENKFHHVRAGVPRAIFEVNSQMGVVKIGTDVQVSPDKFEDLLEFYRKAAQVGVRYCLFGHFGDAHLHFNYMPTKDESAKCLDEIQKLYDEVLAWKGSPFAEHGIGLLKQKYIKRFHGKNQLDLFHDLKKEHDPYNQFFPQGFMNEGL
ncbi:FAD-binding oxidoreductase [Peredibacter starrii]|uniref:D-lactate dehydrogenase (cytochrome) n=1 Tax=Peredibacter starrii TaxID=28202 RepID=A0AAX4HUU9_9BACT|nr:FAD-binding oxidoreductase [Peredibacter starrii]WPU67159.1 FAD-binding oxidoreductase [Peredibacter starrii]